MRKALHDGVPLWRVLLVKNLGLVVIVGVPTLTAATAITLWLETPARLVLTIPNVAVPIVSWLGVGNLMSLLFPVGASHSSIAGHNAETFRANTRWIAHLVLPYDLNFDRRPHRRHRAQPLLESGSAGRLGYFDRRSCVVLLCARPSDRRDTEIG